MSIVELDKELDLLLKKEAERIFSVLLDLYNSKIKVNKSFNKLFNEMIQDKYKPYVNRVQHLVVSLIPTNLMISPNYESIFVTEEEFNNYYKKQKISFLRKNEKKIDELLKEAKNI